MFNNCGETIKKTARIFLILCVVLAVAIAVIDLADMSEYLLGSTGATVAVCAAFVIIGVGGAPMIYGFGEIVDCIKEIRDQGK